MTKLARDELAKFGISIGFEASGAVELVGRNGISCAYSARGFCQVVSLGAPEGAVSVRLRRDGVAELRINSRIFEYRKNDPSLHISIPTGDLDDLIRNSVAKKAGSRK
jgi:hypothetical protein